MTQENDHGEHRRAAEEVHGGPSDGAGDGAGAGDAGADASSSQYFTFTGPPTFTVIGPIMTLAGIVPPLEDEGVKLGEIEAWRAWRVEGDRLQSLVMNSFWEPGEPMRGDPEPRNGEGVYAFKTPKLLKEELPSSCHDDDDTAALGRKMGSEWTSHAYGRVLLWGRIVEHDNGYRAQYAKVLSLEGGPCGRAKLAELCRVYGLPEPPKPPKRRRNRFRVALAAANGLAALLNFSTIPANVLPHPWMAALNGLIGCVALIVCVACFRRSR